MALGVGGPLWAAAALMPRSGVPLLTVGGARRERCSAFGANIAATARGFAASSSSSSSHLDPHAVLSLQRGARRPDIKRAYRRAALRTHPDRVDGCADAFRQVQDAYAQLMSPKPRLGDVLGSAAAAAAKRPSAPTPPRDRGPFRTVPRKKAETMFRDAFGQPLEEVMKAAVEDLGLPAGVHGEAIYEGVYVQQLSKAQAVLDAREADMYASNSDSRALHQVEVSKTREKITDVRGRPLVRYTTTARFPNGRVASSVVEKLVYKL